MANEIRQYANGVGGLIDTQVDTTAGGSFTLSSPSLAALPAVDSAHHMILALDPYGIVGAPEYIHVTAHAATATTCTFTAAQEGSVGRIHTVDEIWSHTTVASDMGAPQWQLQLNDPGTSLTPNFTVGAGTWTADAVGLHHTSTAVAWERIYAGPFAGHGFACQAEMRMPSAGLATGTVIMGMNVGGPPSNAGGGASLKLTRSSGAFTYTWEDDGLTAQGTPPGTWALDTWYTMKLIRFGTSVTAYINNVYVQGATLSLTQQQNDYLRLDAYSAATDFRNVKAWILTPPSF